MSDDAVSPEMLAFTAELQALLHKYKAVMVPDRSGVGVVLGEVQYELHDSSSVGGRPATVHLGDLRIVNWEPVSNRIY